MPDIIRHIINYTSVFRICLFVPTRQDFKLSHIITRLTSSLSKRQRKPHEGRRFQKVYGGHITSKNFFWTLYSCFPTMGAHTYQFRILSNQSISCYSYQISLSYRVRQSCRHFDYYFNISQILSLKGSQNLNYKSIDIFPIVKF